MAVPIPDFSFEQNKKTAKDFLKGGGVLKLIIKRTSDLQNLRVLW
jgi:hypothetical protein